MAYLGYNRPNVERGEHGCYAGQRLMFPVPSDEEGARLFQEALDTFSMMIRHIRILKEPGFLKNYSTLTSIKSFFLMNKTEKIMIPPCTNDVGEK